ncbi:nucleotidyltransferase family protein [Kordiimonas lacus]|uniref:Uncharacterized nucleotidyltransferase n=1 Tax=Kordiimonas lacus TaxID=637679 RepID=A0A1G6W328_9PROT|nr:nucleotidyltransferase family protein [Kordiimonas lacus]SDD60272.1 Uncharacterised nucleotidyltransferase [Kordiimonas lacus]
MIQRAPDIKDFLRIATGQAPLPDQPQALAAFTLWAQQSHILGQVAAVVDAPVGTKLAEILENARLRSSYDQRMLTFETNRIKRALMGADIQPILLKGSAYVAEHLLASIGRRVSDIDILVPEAQLGETERLLGQAGWRAEESTSGAYDQQYYRRWMHELPPLRHVTRRTLIDVHHRLLPRTSRIRPDHLKMMAAARQIEGSDLMVFSPTDRFIHSAIHIFGDGAFETPARSFIELYYLYQDLSDDERQGLLARATDVGAQKPTAEALWMLDEYFDIKAGGARASLVLKSCLRSVTAGQGSGQFLANSVLYVRSHYMRMPLPLLLGHLWKKLLRRV